jgi:serine/threonine-protein kinase RsbW
MTSTGSHRLLHRRKEFPTRIAAFGEIKSFLESFGADASLHPEDWLKLVLLAEELFTNTIRHGYAGESDELVVVEVESLDKHVRLIYEDNAAAYNPLSAAERVNLRLPPEERPVGGLGMLLTVRLAESASYSFSGGRNRVELTLVRSR